MISQKIPKSCGIIYRIRNNLDIKSKKHIYYSLIHLYLTYCISYMVFNKLIIGEYKFKKSFSLFIIIIIKKGQQCKAGREWYTPYQSEDPSPTIPTYRQKEEKGKKSRRL